MIFILLIKINKLLMLAYAWAAFQIVASLVWGWVVEALPTPALAGAFASQR